MNVAIKDAHQLTRVSQANVLLAFKALKIFWVSERNLKETLFQFNFHLRLS